LRFDGLDDGLQGGGRLETDLSHTCTEGITEHGGAEASMATASGSFWEISCIGFEGWLLDIWKESAILIANCLSIQTLCLLIISHDYVSRASAESGKVIAKFGKVAEPFFSHKV